MLHKCANPACLNPFRKLSEGKLFLIEMRSSSSPNRNGKNWDGSSPHRIEHFWLCRQCASVLTLSFEKGKGMTTVPLPQAAAKKPPASVLLAEVTEGAVCEENVPC